MGPLIVAGSAILAFFLLAVAAGVAAEFVRTVVWTATGLAEWSRNNARPVEETAARAVGKRTDVEVWGGSRWDANRRSWTTYFATFELESGDRLEFELAGPRFGLLVVGDEGTLRYQGTRYHGFSRSNVKAPADVDFG